MNVERGMCRVSFWLEEPEQVSKYGDIDYVMSWTQSDYVYSRCEEFIGEFDECGGNYVILKYDSIEDLDENTKSDAATLKRLILEAR